MARIPASVALPQAEIGRFLHAEHSNPHAALGMHPVKVKGKDALVVRAFVRGAVTCEVVDYRAEPERRYPLVQRAQEGFFEGLITDHGGDAFCYRLRVEKENGEIRQFHDPYRFLPSISDHDLYLFNQGNDHFVYRKLGAHLRTLDGVPGVAFAVWAPAARRISVVGDFNGWDGRFHPMRPLGSSGVWELFIPGLGVGEKYKFEVWGADGYLHVKTDPYGQAFEAPPWNAALVVDEAPFAWTDDAWIEQRARTNWRERPMSVYEMHFGSWKRVAEDGNRPLTYREMAGELVPYLLEMGYTHVEFLPLAEHPFSGSWGYQVTGFFAPTHRFGRPDDFRHLVNELHRHGIGVIMDWVPAHFPKDAFALANFDGTHLYEHADPRQGYHNDWDTLIFNYGRHEVRNFLIGSALSWMERYHIDGLRVDAVASMLYLDYSRKEGEWIPNRHGGNHNLEAIEFIQKTNELVHHYYPGALMIAEESTAYAGVTKPVEQGGLGFDFKWNMGWMHDTLQYFSKDAIHRKYHHHHLTFGMVYQYSEAFVQAFSHDEVVHGKGSLVRKMAAWNSRDQARNLRALYAWMWAWPGKKCLFMGQDFAQTAEWAYDHSLSWELLAYDDHNGTQRLVRDLNAWYRTGPSLAERDHDGNGFEWVSLSDHENSVVSFLRLGKRATDSFLVIGNFTPVERTRYRVGIPYAGFWREVINSDAEIYGGMGAGNLGGRSSEPVRFDHHPHSLELTLPGLSVLVLRFEG